MDFANFLLNEDKAYLGQKIGDISSALASLQEDGKGMNGRQLSDNAQAIVNQIRRILHTSWADSERKHLKELQKVGVVLATAVGDKGDILNSISDCLSHMQNIQNSIGKPINSLANTNSMPKQPPSNILPPT